MVRSRASRAVGLRNSFAFPGRVEIATRAKALVTLGANSISQGLSVVYMSRGRSTEPADRLSKSESGGPDSGIMNGVDRFSSSP